MVISGSIPDADMGQLVQGQLTVSGGMPPYVWSIYGGAGFAIQESTGAVIGSPADIGPLPVTVVVRDSRHQEARLELRPVGRLGTGPIGAKFVYREGDDVVIAGPGPSDRRRVALPGIPGRVDQVSPDGRWASLRTEVRFVPTWVTVSLETGTIVDGLGGCWNYSPNSRWALCSKADEPAEVVLRDFGTGASIPAAITATVGGWLDNDTMWAVEHLPGIRKRIRTVPVQPPVQLAATLMEFDAHHVVEMLDNSTAVAQAVGGLYRFSANGQRRLLVDGSTSCVVSHTRAIMACAKFGVTAAPAGPGLTRFTFPTRGTITFRNPRTGAAVRTVNRNDCLLGGVKFAANGNLIAACVPATASAMGGRSIVVQTDSLEYMKIANVAVLGKSVIINPGNGRMTVGPKLNFDRSTPLFG